LTDGPNVRASLSYKDSTLGPDIDFTFNPSEYTITVATSWKQTPAKGKKAPKSEFTGTLPRTLAFDALLVDNWTGRETDTDGTIRRLMKMGQPTPQSVAKSKPSAPVLMFSFGDHGIWFDCHLKQMTIKAQLFNEWGDCTRATVSIMLEEVSDEPARQNPTSGGPTGNRAHLVSDGDSLASIAFREYDDAALWRGLADLNGIDDPMGLRIGQRLIIPAFAQVAARS
jgi:nucleoid-associated protein YgaU